MGHFPEIEETKKENNSFVSSMIRFTKIFKIEVVCINM